MYSCCTASRISRSITLTSSLSPICGGRCKERRKNSFAMKWLRSLCVLTALTTHSLMVWKPSWNFLSHFIWSFHILFAHFRPIFNIWWTLLRSWERRKNSLAQKWLLSYCSKCNWQNSRSLGKSDGTLLDSIIPWASGSFLNWIQTHLGLSTLIIFLQKILFR